MKVNNDDRPKLLVVDDEPGNLNVMKQILQADYQLIFAKSGLRALELAIEHLPNLILLDIMMPSISGLETCKRMKLVPELARIPVIFVTAMSDIEDEAKGFKAGAVDYITKPVSPPIVRARVENHLRLVSVNEIHNTRLEIIQRLGRAAEYRDNETGLHVIRMSQYSKKLAQAIGLSTEQCELILHAAPMHDVGKIGIPDHILLKPGPLDPEEWVIMKKHTTIGAEIIGVHDSMLLNTARIIASCHHERWDGKGYPAGLEGTQIPVESRIVSVCDVFDALTTKRPYKEAWTIEDALEFVNANSGTMFDPHLVKKFMGILPSILKIKSEWGEGRVH